jgi:hypothetical protein
MEQTHLENLQLGRLVADALGEIERLGYSKRSRHRYRTTWGHLIEFSHRKELGDEFSADLMARFLEEYRIRDEQMDEPSDGWRPHIAFEVKVLADFAKNGRIERPFTEVQTIHLVPPMQKTLRDYEQYCKDRLHLRAYGGPPIPSVYYTQGTGHPKRILAPSPFKVARPSPTKPNKLNKLKQAQQAQAGIVNCLTLRRPSCNERPLP